VAQIEKRRGRSALVRHALHRQTDYFRVARNPSRIDAKRGDHFLQADFSGLIRTVEPGYLPVSRLLVQNR